ncbi:hydroxymethylbilane synthase [Muriicola sp. Z0-33]|uniref:hydroxymethylbilane synthase n=1 Tax=Muriicola sp. Z0-33 TaxID=2816957 RepID=UPI002237E8CD|nr:hydroxymethylbilane synthase [Muriicola sp. Z0-33]MCW5516353.1 hydroxymethylbilane synthase [Muriicola sp. Z0-33]
MSQVIRIGTRDSELALWQAKTVSNQLEYLGHKTALIPIKSAGDLDLEQPLHELGITGVFTKALDIAMLRGEIDIAVHSFKDVPTSLPKGMVQAAVLKRGNSNDFLIFKDNEEFLAHESATIATGSLRRKAQWLNRYPTHSIVALRGNVNTRLKKLKEHDWNGAIFAAAGLERIGLKPKNAVSLGWMIPAPAQGAIMIAAMEDNNFVREACSELNDEDTSLCTSIEREFLKLLEGGCTAPIGALAYIKQEEVYFKGVLLSLDGTQKIEVTRTAPLGKHQHIAKECAAIVFKRGGKRVMNELQGVKKTFQVYSTKKLTAEQLHLFGDGISVGGDDFIQINHNRISAQLLNSEIENVVLSSKKAVDALVFSSDPRKLKFKNIYCVGRKTKRLVERKIGKVKHTENNAKLLAEYLLSHLEGKEITFFCSDQRLNDLPDILSENGIIVNEVQAYQTRYSPSKVDEETQGVLFFSPSAVKSYLLKNSPDKIAFCIGDTTASEANKHFKEVQTAKFPAIDAVAELVNSHYKVGA